MKITGQWSEIDTNSEFVNEQAVIFSYWVPENDPGLNGIPYEQGTVIVFLSDPGDKQNPPRMKFAILSGTIQSAAVKGNISQKDTIFYENNVIASITLANGGLNVTDEHKPENVAAFIVSQREKKWNKYLEAQNALTK